MTLARPFARAASRPLASAASCAFGCAAFIPLACAPGTGSVGAVLAQSRHDGIVVVREAPAGMAAASAGLRVGDEVLLVDGRDPRAMTPEQIHQALEGPVGSRVRITALHDGAVLRLELVRQPLQR